MPEEQQRFAKAVHRMMDAIIFDQWLRFYFLAEREVQGQEEPLFLVAVPDKAMEQIRQRYGTLTEIAEALNGREASLDHSRKAVVTFISRELEGTLVPAGGVPACMDSRAFQNTLHLFNAWIQAAEDMLDQTFMDFDQWRDAFAAYKDSEAGQRILAQMEAEGQQGQESPAAAG